MTAALGALERREVVATARGQVTLDRLRARRRLGDRSAEVEALCRHVAGQDGDLRRVLALVAERPRAGADHPHLEGELLAGEGVPRRLERECVLRPARLSERGAAETVDARAEHGLQDAVAHAELPVGRHQHA
jgi:hypothetical protein